MVRLFRNKGGQMFMLWMVFFTVFLIGIYVLLHIQNQGDLYSEIVSPKNVLASSEQSDFFEKSEEFVLKYYFCKKSGNIEEDFCSNFFVKQSFLFEDGFYYGETSVPIEFLEVDKRMEMCSVVYDFSYLGDNLVVERSNFGKKTTLVSEKGEDEESDFLHIVDYDLSFGEKDYRLSSSDCE